MSRFNKAKLISIAKKRGVILKGLPVRFTGNQRIYDFDVSGDTRITRLKIAYFSNEKTIPNIANIYSGSSKYGLQYKNYEDLVNQIRLYR